MKAANPSACSRSLSSRGSVPTIFSGSECFPKSHRRDKNTICIEIVQATHTSIDDRFETCSRKDWAPISKNCKCRHSNLHWYLLSKGSSWRLILIQSASTVDLYSPRGLEKRHDKYCILHRLPAVRSTHKVVPTTIICRNHTGIGRVAVHTAWGWSVPVNQLV